MALCALLTNFTDSPLSAWMPGIRSRMVMKTPEVRAIHRRDCASIAANGAFGAIIASRHLYVILEFANSALFTSPTSPNACFAHWACRAPCCRLIACQSPWTAQDADARAVVTRRSSTPAFLAMPLALQIGYLPWWALCAIRLLSKVVGSPSRTIRACN